MCGCTWWGLRQSTSVQRGSAVPSDLLPGGRPTRASRLRPALPRSFGGFGALTRHLGRLSGAICEALETGMVDARSLALINAYNPGLSGAWMLQRAMSIRSDARSYRADFINRLLAANFKVGGELRGQAAAAAGGVGRQLPLARPSHPSSMPACACCLLGMLVPTRLAASVFCRRWRSWGSPP